MFFFRIRKPYQIDPGSTLEKFQIKNQVAVDGTTAEIPNRTEHRISSNKQIEARTRINHMAFILLIAGALAMPMGYSILGYALIAVGFIMHITAPAENSSTVKRALGYIVLAAIAVGIPMAYEHYYYRTR